MTYKNTMAYRKLIFPDTVPVETFYKAIGEKLREILSQ